MKTTNRLLAVLLSLVLLCSGLPFAFAEDVTIIDSGTDDNLTWTFDSEGVLMINGDGEMFGNILRLPSWLTYRGVITKVIIKEGVTSIGHHAFYNYSALTSVTIPDSVTSIEEFAFFGCTSLASVSFGDSLQSIGNYAFACCDLLETVNFNHSSPRVGEGAFFACPLITDFPTDLSGTCGENITWTLDSAGSMLISGNGSMTNYSSADGPHPQWLSVKDAIHTVSIGSGVTNIGSEAFEHCTSLKSVTIPDSVTSIGGRAFEGCTSLTGVTIPDSVTTIGEWAFAFCSLLTSVTIPDSVTSIDGGAFSRCTALTCVTIGNSVMSIGWSAFSNCTALSTVNYTGSEDRWYKKVDIGDGNLPLRTANIIFDYCPHAHTTETEPVAPTCSSVGYTAGVFCTDCEKYVSGHEELPVLPHTFTSWSRFVMASDAAVAVEIRFCNTCGYYELRQADPANPTDPTEPTNPTEPTDPTDPTNPPDPGIHAHVYNDAPDIAAVAPTCTTDGHGKGWTCTVPGCGAVKWEAGNFKALGHQEVVISAVEATCTEDGSTEGIKCSRCGTILVAPTTIKIDHVDDNNDGKCDTCGAQMTGGDHCKYCGKIHSGAFGWLTKFFHSILAIFKR